MPPPPASLIAAARWFDYWGTPILAGAAVVILLGLVYRWGNVKLVRPVLRALACAGSLMAVVGVAGLIVTIQDFAGDLSPTGWAGSTPPPSCSSTSASWC